MKGLRLMEAMQNAPYHNLISGHSVIQTQGYRTRKLGLSISTSFCQLDTGEPARQPFKGPMEVCMMASFPAKCICNTIVHLPQCWYIDVILEESPKAIWATSQRFTILFVNLINLSFA